MQKTITDLGRDQYIGLLSNEYYGLMFLGLANAAYTSDGSKDPEQIKADLKFAVESTDYIPLMPDIDQQGISTALRVVDGFWHLDWGPGVAEDRSNLAYIASYRTPVAAGFEPYFFVVGIRGTDVSAGAKAVEDQIFQDFDAFSAKPWDTYLTEGVDIEIKEGSKKRTRRFGPAPSIGAGGVLPTGKVANGTIVGFDKIASLQGTLYGSPDSDFEPQIMDIVHALQAIVEQNENPVLKTKQTPIIVTGHSLGGCQTQVMASYLSWQFPAHDVIAQPFAPSTAGNAAFAGQDVFKRGCFWRNTLDLVPAGFGNFVNADTKTELDVSWAVDNLWTSEYWPLGESDVGGKGPELPFKSEIENLIKNHGEDLLSINYTRPNAGMLDVPLSGHLPTLKIMKEFLKEMGEHDLEAKGSLAQLMWQHFPPNYRALMWEQKKQDLVYFNYQTYKNPAS